MYKIKDSKKYWNEDGDPIEQVKDLTLVFGLTDEV